MQNPACILSKHYKVCLRFVNQTLSFSLFSCKASRPTSRHASENSTDEWKEKKKKTEGTYWQRETTYRVQEEHNLQRDPLYILLRLSLRQWERNGKKTCCLSVSDKNIQKAKMPAHGWRHTILLLHYYT